MNISLSKEDIIESIQEEGYKDDIEFIVDIVNESTSTYDTQEEVITQILLQNIESIPIIINNLTESMPNEIKHRIITELNL